MGSINELVELGLPLETAKTLVLVSFLISSLIIILAFVLKAIAIRTMAKNRGLDKLYLAFIPFFNYILLGRVIGTVFLFRKKVNNIGLLVTIFSLVGFVINTLLYLGDYVADIAAFWCYYVQEISPFLGIDSIDYGSVFVQNWMCKTGIFHDVIEFIYFILSLINTVLTISLIFFVLRKYAPERAFIYAIVCIFIDLAFGIILFIIRNRKPYATITRTYVRPNYNSYDQYNQNKKPENDPFPEFNGYEQSNNTSEKSNSKDDDFFN